MEIQNFRAEIIIISLVQHKLKLVPSLATTLLLRSPSFVRQNFYFLLFGKCKRHNFQKYVSRSCWKLKAIVRRPSSFFASKKKTDDDGLFYVKTWRRKKRKSGGLVVDSNESKNGREHLYEQNLLRERNGAKL